MKTERKRCRTIQVFILSLSVIVAAGIFSPSVSSDLNVGVIESDRILEVHPAFRDAQQEYQAEVQQMQQQLEGMEEDEQMMAQQMLQQQLQEVGARLQTEALDALREDVTKIAEEKGYDYVFDSNVIFYGGMDITDEIIEALDIETPEEEGIPGDLMIE